jgi:hypothetical protein
MGEKETREAFEMLMSSRTNPNQPVMRRINEVEPDDGLKLGSRLFKLDINEADLIDVDITMCDGTRGNLQIKGTTLAQIILDRNARAAPAVEAPTVTNEIQVGDGDLPAGAQTVSKIVPADDLIAASRKSIKPLKPLPLPPVKPPNPNGDAWTQKGDDWRAMVRRHGYDMP